MTPAEKHKMVMDCYDRIRTRIQVHLYFGGYKRYADWCEGHGLVPLELGDLRKPGEKVKT